MKLVLRYSPDSGPRCVATLHSVHSSRRGKLCRRRARFLFRVEGAPVPVCGLHEFGGLRKRMERVWGDYGAALRRPGEP
jgi:hypothetical protein